MLTSANTTNPNLLLLIELVLCLPILQRGFIDTLCAPFHRGTPAGLQLPWLPPIHIHNLWLAMMHTLSVLPRSVIVVVPFPTTHGALVVPLLLGMSIIKSMDNDRGGGRRNSRDEVFV